jgi:hypothetical protein
MIIFLALPLAWYGFSIRYDFRLLPSGSKNDISVRLTADGRSIEASVLNDSGYTINSLKIVCKSTVLLGECSMAAMLQDIVNQGLSGHKNAYSCRALTNEVHESFIRRYIFPYTVYKEFIETKDTWPADSLSCIVEDPRGYKSYWFERFIGRVLMSGF